MCGVFSHVFPDSSHGIFAKKCGIGIIWIKLSSLVCFGLWSQACLIEGAWVVLSQLSLLSACNCHLASNAFGCWILFCRYCSSRTVRQTPMLSCLGSLTDGRSIHLWIALCLVSALFWYIAPKFFIFLTMVDNSYHRDYRKTKENVNYYVTIRK